MLNTSCSVCLGRRERMREGGGWKALSNQAPAPDLLRFVQVLAFAAQNLLFSFSF